MRGLQHTFLKNTPLLFLLVAVFHIVIAVHAIYSFHDVDLRDWLHPLLIVLYTLLWLWVCTMRKAAAYSYIGLTIVCTLIAFVLAPQYPNLISFDTPLFPIDMLFSIIILVYFKKFI